MRITYFASDLVDAATVRHVRILRRGGADLTLFGFRRSITPVTEVDGVAAIDLGQTYPGRLGHRAAQVLQHSWGAKAWRDKITRSDVLLARNIEMATIADTARLWAASRVPLVYACLDIHAAQLGTGIPSKLLRNWERRILRRASKLVVSSRSFVTHYFDHLGVALPEIILVENKRVLSETDAYRSQDDANGRRPPWRLGWFGLLRDGESFEILLHAAKRRTDVDITLRGRPVPSFQDLIDRHLPLPNMRFSGPYTEKDLAMIYGACDLTWAVEYVGQNAQNPNWALGNRIYEGGYYNNPVIALAGTAMGDWLQQRQVGVVLKDPRREFEAFIEALSVERYQELRRAAVDLPTRDLAWTTEDCQELVRKMQSRNSD
jgi:hypothetical protein